MKDVKGGSVKRMVFGYFLDVRSFRKFTKLFANTNRSVFSCKITLNELLDDAIDKL